MEIYCLLKLELFIWLTEEFHPTFSLSINYVSSDVLTDDDWQEAHERLAELEEKLPVAVNEQTGNGERDEMDLLGDHEENLAERLSKMVIENELEDPAIMRAVQTRPVLQVSKLL